MPVEKCLRAVLGFVRRRQNSNLLKVNKFARHFDTKHAILSSMFTLKETAEEIVKGKVRFSCRSYGIFGPDSLLNIYSYPKNFVTKRNFKALTRTL